MLMKSDINVSKNNIMYVIIQLRYYLSNFGCVIVRDSNKHINSDNINLVLRLTDFMDRDQLLELSKYIVSIPGIIEESPMNKNSRNKNEHNSILKSSSPTRASLSPSRGSYMDDMKSSSGSSPGKKKRVVMQVKEPIEIIEDTPIDDSISSTP
jgi:hypothetical protein